MKKILFVSILMFVSVLLFSCKKEEVYVGVDRLTNVVITPQNPYADKVFLDWVMGSDSDENFSKVITSYEELIDTSSNYQLLNNSHIVFEDFDFNDSNILLVFKRTWVCYSPKDLELEEFEISQNTININVNYDSDFVAFAITSNLLIFNVPKYVSNSYSVVHNLI
jgi:hypothetical protein